MHCFLLLNNVSAVEAGQKHILCLDNEKSQCIIVESLFAMFCYFNKNTAFDFVSNLMANLACVSEGRKWMLDNGMFEAISLQLLTKQPNTHRRKSLIQCLRHLTFEYEQYEAKFLEKNVPRDLCKLLIDEQGIQAEQLVDSWKPYAAKREPTLCDWGNMESLIDSLVLLGNSDALLNRLKTIELDSLINVLSLPKDGMDDMKARIQALQG